MPAWKIQTRAPNTADRESTLTSTASTGRSTDPKARNSRTSIAATTSSPATGSRSPRLVVRSTNSAVRPPSTSAPSGAGRARTDARVSAPASDSGSASCVTVRPVTPLPSPRSATEATPGTDSNAWTYDGRPSAPPTTATSSGAVDWPGNSSSSASATTRTSLSAGSARASTVPNSMRRNGTPSRSSRPSVPASTATGRRSTPRADRPQNAPPAVSRRLRNGRRSASTRWPSMPSSAGSTVNDGYRGLVAELEVARDAAAPGGACTA